MCDYTKVEYACGHLRYTVRAWCTRYQETHKRCPANVVAVEHRMNEKCGDCREPQKPMYTLNKKASMSPVTATDSSNAAKSSQ